MYNQADEPVEYLSPEEDLNTKLLLAVSYKDLNSPDIGEVQTALAMLQEVSAKGNADQQAQAALLLSTINQV